VGQIPGVGAVDPHQKENQVDKIDRSPNPASSRST
jgi:hypothetical protein